MSGGHFDYAQSSFLYNAVEPLGEHLTGLYLVMTAKKTSTSV
jgi:hypothetical protein